MRKQNKKFEDAYFKGYFHGAVGNFAEHDLEISRRWFWGWFKKLENYISLKDGRNKNALEIGCSIGGVTSLLTDRGYNVWASDVSKLAVKKAAKLNPKAKFLQFNAEKGIPIKLKFDLIIAFEVVEHLERPDKALKHMYGSLKKNGILVFSSPYPYKWSYSDPTHINVKYPHEWIELAKKAGFKKTEYHCFSLMPFLYKIHKNLHVILPFHVPVPYINNPIFFIGKK